MANFSPKMLRHLTSTHHQQCRGVAAASRPPQALFPRKSLWLPLAELSGPPVMGPKWCPGAPVARSKAKDKAERENITRHALTQIMPFKVCAYLRMWRVLIAPIWCQGTTLITRRKYLFHQCLCRSKSHLHTCKTVFNLLSLSLESLNYDLITQCQLPASLLPQRVLSCSGYFTPISRATCGWVKTC